MIPQPAIEHERPVPESQTQPVAERDTLNDSLELRFLRDEIEALLGAAAVRFTSKHAHIGYVDGDPGAAGADSSIRDRDTEPNIDAELVREIARTLGK